MGPDVFVGMIALLAMIAAASTPNPRAHELFDRDPVLKLWAIQRFDENHDGWLTSYEAQAAAEAFRDIADENRDGQVSVGEYSAAVDFIRARY